VVFRIVKVALRLIPGAAETPPDGSIDRDQAALDLRGGDLGVAVPCALVSAYLMCVLMVGSAAASAAPSTCARVRLGSPWRRRTSREASPS